MRIGSGRWRRRIIETPKSDLVRPMADKVRAALFDVLGSVEGLAVLDLYAGSGAVGLEAASRGAARVVLVDQDKQAARVIERNLDKLAAGGIKLINRPVEAWLAAAQSSSFDIIVADPPYANIKASVLEQAAPLLRPGGIMVVSHSSKIASLQLKSLVLVQTKTYGDTALSFFRKN